MKWRTLAVCILAAVTLVACPPDFTPYWKVDKLRVMAIKADPVVAKYMEPVTLSALVYAPPGQEVTYDWSWCPIRPSAQNDYECFIERDDFQDLIADEEQDQIPEDIFNLGDGEEAIFVNPFTTEEVRQFCQEIQRRVIEEADDPELARFLPGGGCTRGFEVSVRLEVRTDNDYIAATKRFTLWGGDEDHNENPEFEDFQIRPAESQHLSRLRDQAGWDVPSGADREDQWVSIYDRDEPLFIVADMPFEIRGLVDPDSLLTYTPPPPRGQESEEPDPRVEALDYRYFTTLGGLSRSSRLFVDGENTLEEAPITRFSVSSEQLDEDCQEPVDGGCQMTLWSVVRDSRLGIDWIGGELVVQEGDQ